MSCNLWSVFLPVSPSPCHPLASSFIRMDYSNLRRQAASMKKSLFDQACIILWRFLINILSLCFHKDLEVRSYLSWDLSQRHLVPALCFLINILSLCFHKDILFQLSHLSDYILSWDLSRENFLRNLRMLLFKDHGRNSLFHWPTKQTKGTITTVYKVNILIFALP